MTKLPQTISKRVNIITGEEVPLGCIDPHYQRSSGRTTAIALELISKALQFGKAVGVDHFDSKEALNHLVDETRMLVRAMKLDGFSIVLVSNTRGISTLPNPDKPAVLVEFNLYKEIHYDLRK